MRDTSEARLDATKYHWHVREETLQYLRVDDARIVWAQSSLSVGRVSVIMTYAPCGRILVDHGVHGTRRYTEEESRSSQFLKVAVVTMPVWLRHYSHAIACTLEDASYHGCAE